jgi:hypothetical protein
MLLGAAAPYARTGPADPALGKRLAISPGVHTVSVKVVFVAFSEGQAIPPEAEEVFAGVSDYYRAMSLGKHAVSFSIIRRPAPDQASAYTPKRPAAYYKAILEHYQAKSGILQKEIFEKVYRDDPTAFDDADVVLVVMLESMFEGFTGVGNLGGYNEAGFPTDIYDGPGITTLWLETVVDNQYNVAHEYGHQLGLHHPPQNEAHRYYGWYSLMYNRSLDETGIRPPAAPQFVYNDMWLDDDDVIVISGDMKNAVIEPFIETHRLYLYFGENNNVFFIANYQGTGHDSLYAGTGLLIWHTRRWDVWDVEAAHGNWADGRPGTTPRPDGLPDGSDLLDQKTAEYHSGASDFFDGRTYTAFTGGTNPNTNLYPADTSTSRPGYSLYNDTTRTLPQTTPSHFAMCNLRRKASSGADTAVMIADFYVNNWTGRISSNTVWEYHTHVSGDIVIDAGATLTIKRGVQVSFEPSFDDRAGGTFTDKAEIIVNGTLNLEGTRFAPVTFTSSADAPVDGDWGGITVNGTMNPGVYRYRYAAQDVVQN